MDDNPQQPERPSRIPFSQPPAKPKTWWGTVPGQIFILVVIAAVILIALGLAGVVGPRSLK